MKKNKSTILKFFCFVNKLPSCQNLLSSCEYCMQFVFLDLQSAGKYKMIDALNFSAEIRAFRERIEKLSGVLAPLEESLPRAQRIAAANNVIKTRTTLSDLMLTMSVSIGQLSSRMDILKELSGKLLNEVMNVVAEAGSVNEKLLDVVVTSLSNEDISRYSRQLILPDFGVAGQLKLKQSSFLVVGVGGLGCPAALYLVAVGCGRIGLVDYDLVERSNIHRQTLHTEQSVDQPKVVSAKVSLQSINPTCQIDVYQLLLDSLNALELLDQYDIILDCTDNVATRYLLNDACVLLNKPLVSGSALQLDGQLTVYHYQNGPCYRCLFPVPPPAETVTNCGDGGVLGAVTGVIGSLQALEAIKVAINLGEVLSGRLLIFDGSKCIFRNIKLRPKRSECDACSDTPQITRLINYEQFCGMLPSDKDQTLALLRPNQRISALEYKEKLWQRPHVLVDVRTAAEFEICQLPNAVNVPLKQVLNDSFGDHLREQLKQKQLPCLVYCRRGNDSQVAVQHLRIRFPDNEYIKDIEGGLHAWHHKVDKEFPIY